MHGEFYDDHLYFNLCRYKYLILRMLQCILGLILVLSIVHCSLNVARLPVTMIWQAPWPRSQCGLCRVSPGGSGQDSDREGCCNNVRIIVINCEKIFYFMNYFILTSQSHAPEWIGIQNFYSWKRFFHELICTLKGGEGLSRSPFWANLFEGMVDPCGWGQRLMRRN